jgi:hypothetical protein
MPSPRKPADQVFTHARWTVVVPTGPDFRKETWDPVFRAATRQGRLCELFRRRASLNPETAHSSGAATPGFPARSGARARSTCPA